MTLGSVALRHRWGFVSDDELATAARASQNATAAGAALAVIGLQDRISATLLRSPSEASERPDRPLLLAADAGVGIAPQLLQAFPPAWQAVATAGAEWHIARTLLPANDEQARLLVAIVDAPAELALNIRLSQHQGTELHQEERLLLSAPIGGQRWREWHLLLPATDNLRLDQLLRQPLVIDWSQNENRGKLIFDLYRDFPFLDQ